MGLLDKLKAMLSGNKEQVKSGIDKASTTAQKAVPDQHDAKVDMAADKAKNVVDGLGGRHRRTDDIDDTVDTDDTPVDTDDAPVDATGLSAESWRDEGGAAAAGRAPFVSLVQSLPVSLSLTLSTPSLTLPAASSTLPSDLRLLSSVRSPTACLILPLA